MKNLRITLLAICVITSVYAQKDKRLKGLDKELNKILKLTKTPGFSVAIVEGKKIIYAKGQRIEVGWNSAVDDKDIYKWLL